MYASLAVGQDEGVVPPAGTISGMRRYCCAHTVADSESAPTVPPMTARTVYVADAVPALSR